MLTATRDIKLPTSIIGSLPRPSWYTVTLGTNSFLSAMTNSTDRDQYTDAVSAYLRSVEFIPSPWHRQADGSLDALAQRGRRVFERAQCDMCHPEPLYTDLEMYNVGTQGPRDFPEHKRFDVPTLKELYRTAPFLHDGRAATLREVLTTYNLEDRHGKTSRLSPEDIDALIAFLKTL